MNFLCEHTIILPQLAYHLSMVKAVSSMVVLINSDYSNSVNLFNFAMCSLASMIFPLSWSHVLMDGEKLDDK